MFAIESGEREERFEFLDAVDLCAADRSFGRGSTCSMTLGGFCSTCS